MPRAEAPGWAWLVAHELRLMYRGFVVRAWLAAIVIGGVLLVMHFAGWAFWRGDLLGRSLRAAPALVAVTTMFVAMLVLSSAFSLAVRALFERGDLDLMLSAPVRPVHVFTARALGAAAGAVVPAGFFVLPIDMGVFAGHPGRWRRIPRSSRSGRSACAAVAFVVTLALVRWIGARRARVASQVMGALVGAAFVLMTQVQPLLPRATRLAFERWLREGGFERAFGPDSVALWPLRAMLGEPLPLAVLVGGAVALFALVVRSTARRFVEAAQQAPEAAGAKARGAGEGFPRGARVRRGRQGAAPHRPRSAARRKIAAAGALPDPALRGDAARRPRAHRARGRLGAA